ncbi:MaoC/PaaZ C-terminal domain-containing protein [Saccharothrix longispora]|uniref:MaoC/PaaZ C-terminal domain-containing protein n=1 Tax=Saccharothrix longispora TaxID=33920 RepID=UPI0028FD9B04|nr:MaoC/PaaZ C-terminal domain-containing protein [Saccharothrix longispora]MDU0291155.1 MaoC/PaaZ C-terminal domain-containing protein [Saccharothrix longispora]
MSAPETGDPLPVLEVAAITAEKLRDFAVVSGDDNPVHLDDEAARRGGLDGVVAHGMLVMAHLGRLVTSWPAAGALRSFRTRFTAPTPLGARVTCTGKVVSVDVVDGTPCARLRVVASRDDGVAVARGEAVVELTGVTG